MHESSDEKDLPTETDEQAASKSQKKREMHELLKLTEKALTLSDEKLTKTGLDEKVLAAMKEARKMKASGARNRLLKYITKMISHMNTQILAAYLTETEDAHLGETKHFHQLEQWRERMIDQGDDIIGEFLNTHPGADRQQLRALIRQAQKEKLQEKPPVASRKLFKYLRSITE